MEDGAISLDALLQGLAGLHLPAHAPGGALAEAFAAISLGLFLAIALGAVLKLVTARSRKAAPESLADRVQALSHLPEAERRVALLHVLKSTAPERYAALRATLYRPEGGPSLDRLEQEVLRHV